MLTAESLTKDYRLGAVSGAAWGRVPLTENCGLGRSAAGWGLWAMLELEGWQTTGRYPSPLTVADFKKLDVWHKAHALALSVDRMRKKIRARDYITLRQQIFTSALSIPANIAEGRRKNSDREFARFLGIAVASASELESHLIFARDGGVISQTDFDSLVSQTILIRKMLYALIKRLSDS